MQRTNIDMIRVSSNSQMTLGCIGVNGSPKLWTLELPWRDNQHDISCIPEGTYNAKKWTSPTHGEVIQLLDVPHRTGILIHAGNVAYKDSRGCILIGKTFSKLGGEPAVLHSREALTELLNELPDGETYSLAIWDGFAGIPPS